MRDRNLRRLPSVLVMVVTGVTLARLLIISAITGNASLVVSALIMAAIMAAIGLPLLGLAAIEEANLWREAGVWVSLLAYAGTMVGIQMDMVGMGDVLWFSGAALGLVALPFTLIAFAFADSEEPSDDAGERRREVQRGLERGATLGSGLLLAGGLLLILANPQLFADGEHRAAVVALVVIAFAIFVGGAYLHAPPRSARLGLAMLWIGAVALIVVSVLDTIPATTISGPPPSDWGLDAGVSGIAFVFLPGAVLGLVAAIVGTTVGGHGQDGRPISAGPAPPRATAPLGEV